MDTNMLYYGDNLDVLRLYIKDETIDLVYLDPPFNSNQDYNVLFAEKDGSRAAAQIKAFGDTWEWNQEASKQFQEVINRGGQVAQAMLAFRTFLGDNDMLAYLSMMAPRLMELQRVMKHTASIYLHCDPTASAHLRLLMDAVFGPSCFRNEIIWKRTSGHSDAERYGRVHDVLLYYTKATPKWNQPVQDYEEAYKEQYYRYQDPDGRRWMSGDASASGLTGGGYEYQWKGVTRLWRMPESTMARLDAEGRIFYTRNGIPRIKRYLDESHGLPAQDIWTDIQALRSWHDERLEYPTQKPEALLDRIIEASSDDGDLVLDPFCGCGTAVSSAQRLNRRWIGVDVTHLAIGLIKYRLRNAYGDKAAYRVIGEPTSIPDAETLAKEDPYGFQFWALGLVGARPADQKKGADKGIDGRLYFYDDLPGQQTLGKTRQVIFSVKAGHTSVPHVRDLVGVLQREKADMGVLISLQEPTHPMKTEALSAGFYYSDVWAKGYHRVQLLTIAELLGGRIVDMPPIAQVNATFKRAPRAKAPIVPTLEMPLDA